MPHKTTEPTPRDIFDVMKRICLLHGPRRYEACERPVNGAVTLIDARNEFEEAKTVEEQCRVEDPFNGPGVVWAWFVGSPRVFQFGFSRSKSAACKKMYRTMRSEYVLATGKDVVRKGNRWQPSTAKVTAGAPAN